MNSEMILYERMCLAIAQCAAVDEASGIKDKAEQLQAYARVRDNSEAERQFAEIKLRAAIRIGEISRELEKAEPNHGHGAGLPISGKTKEQALAEAGISTSTAQRYEELTGGREEQVQKVAFKAAEHYFAGQKASQELPTMGGLSTAVRSALTEAFGERQPAKQTKIREPDLLTHFLYSADYYARKKNFDSLTIAQDVMEEFAQEDVDACRSILLLMPRPAGRLTPQHSNNARLHTQQRHGNRPLW